MYIVPEIIVQASRDLRKNATLTEKLLWNYLRKEQLGVKILRQKPIYVYSENNGLPRFIIADFYIHECKLVIEIDGGIHLISEVLTLDREKESLLNNRGIKVLRFTNTEVKESAEKVLEKISKNCFSFPNIREG